MTPGGFLKRKLDILFFVSQKEAFFLAAERMETFEVVKPFRGKQNHLLRCREAKRG